MDQKVKCDYDVKTRTHTFRLDSKVLFKLQSFVDKNGNKTRTYIPLCRTETAIYYYFGYDATHFILKRTHANPQAESVVSALADAKASHILVQPARRRVVWYVDNTLSGAWYAMSKTINIVGEVETDCEEFYKVANTSSRVAPPKSTIESVDGEACVTIFGDKINVFKVFVAKK